MRFCVLLLCLFFVPACIKEKIADEIKTGVVNSGKTAVGGSVADLQNEVQAAQEALAGAQARLKSAIVARDKRICEWFGWAFCAIAVILVAVAVYFHSVLSARIAAGFACAAAACFVAAPLVPYRYGIACGIAGIGSLWLLAEIWHHEKKQAKIAL
jgi:hypothetical protein